MTYEKPEALEIGSVEDVVLGQRKKVDEPDEEQLPQFANIQIAELE